MKRWKKVTLIWVILLLIPMCYLVYIFFVLVGSVHVELLDSINIPDKPYKINAYYGDGGATGGGIGLEREYKNGKKDIIYVSDGFFNDVKALELVNDNKLKVILGFKDKDKPPFSKQDTVFIDLEAFEDK